MCGFVGFLELAGIILSGGLQLLLGDDPLPHQRLAVELRNGQTVPDALVHPGLREVGLITLIVAEPPIADEIDDHVLLEPHPVVMGQPDHVDHCLRILPVNVENGDHEHLGHVRRIARGAGILGKRRETDLVVDDHVEGAARAVSLELREIQRFAHDTLPGEGGIAVHENGKSQSAVPFPQLLLPGTGDALHNGIHRLEVARVGDQEQSYGVPLGCLHIREIAFVILDVAASHQGLGVVAVLKFAENRFEGLAQIVHLDVETTPVRHAQDHLPATALRRMPDELVHQGHHGLGSLNGKTLLTQILVVQEMIELHRLGEVSQDAPLVVGLKPGAVPRGLHTLLKPPALARVLQVHVLHPDGMAVGIPKHLDNLTQGELLGIDEGGGEEALFQILLLQPQAFEAEKRMLQGAGLQRVQACQKMPKLPMPCNESLHPSLPQKLSPGTDPLFRCFGGRCEVETFKKGLPFSRHIFRVGLPALIKRINELRALRHCQDHDLCPLFASTHRTLAHATTAGRREQPPASRILSVSQQEISESS